MDIRNNMDGLKSLLGIDSVEPSASRAKTPVAANSADLGSDRATLSSAASEISQAASGEGIRTGKVASVQAALAAGTYHVPASAVASKLVDAMLSGGQ